ncbi:MAG: single-stranded-DNA-specific exonuclease RecJ [Candidatus Eisenbacteria bacterium]|nr:single-stranded-DNA-specific exonuclease RecJ [Candidatus Eisenbacteria bacterium]
MGVSRLRRRWKLPDEGAVRRTEDLSRSLGVPRAFAAVLVSHGVDSEEEARKFLSPDLSMLHDSSLLPDIEPAVERLLRAIGDRERVFVCGDYDVDGITSTVLVMKCLAAAGLEVGFYVPNRLTEGYGLSEAGIAVARDSGARLIVTVDSGITGHREIDIARDAGIDVIVTDHHEPQDDLPDAVAVVDPKRKDSVYPYKHLAGVGVAYKVMTALARAVGDPERARVASLREGAAEGVDPVAALGHSVEENIDLVAVGTVADIVPLTSENRVLTAFGLERLRNTSNPGLRALMEIAGVEPSQARASHIGFALGPRLNAAGRLGDAAVGVELLTTGDHATAMAIARKLDAENKKRRSLESVVFDDAKRMLEETVDLASRRSIVLWSDEWHPGVIGIVASRLAREYNRPTLLLSVSDGHCKGSGRSIPGFDLHAALLGCRDSLESFGGHRHAAGVSLAEGRLTEFRDRVEEAVAATLGPEDLIPEVELDALVTLGECDYDLVRHLDRMAPFGAGNSEPVFGTRSLKLISARAVGTNHLKLTVAQGERSMDAIGFGMAGALAELRDGGGVVSLAYVLEENTWRGQTSLQLRLKDVQPEYY